MWSMTSGVRVRPALWQLLLTSTMLTGVSPAFAAETDRAAGIETVVVTAEKRSEDMQKVPLSIQALPTEKLEQLHITNFNDYVKYLPSVTYTVGGSRRRQRRPGFRQRLHARRFERQRRQPFRFAAHGRHLSRRTADHHDRRGTRRSCLRHRPRRVAGGTAGHAVWRELGSRHDPHHHQQA